MKTDEEISHLDLLESALVEALTEVDLEAVAEGAGASPLTDSGWQPVTVDEVASLADAGFLTHDCGVLVRLSDGSEFTIKIAVHRQPRG